MTDTTLPFGGSKAVPWFATPAGLTEWSPFGTDHVGPRELPGIRQDLLRHDWDRAERYLAENESNLDFFGTRAPLRHMPEDLALAELFSVDESFAKLVAAAHDTMPPHPLTECDPPSPCGLVINQVSKVAGQARHFSDVSGWFWAAKTDHLVAGYVYDQRGFPDRRAHDPRYNIIAYKFAWGDSFDARPYSAGEDGYSAQGEFSQRSHRLYVSNLVVFWNLLRQKAVSEESITTLPRPERRRLQRAGITPPEVRVISLPGSQRTSAPGSDSDREWRHRWVVRGHWRRQWYPRLEDHRPVWIAPHLKGPEDAPLLGGQKVYAVKPPRQSDESLVTREGEAS